MSQDVTAPTPPAFCPECGAAVVARLAGAWCPRCRGHLEKIETRSYDANPPATVLSWVVRRR